MVVRVCAILFMYRQAYHGVLGGEYGDNEMMIDQSTNLNVVRDSYANVSSA